MSVIVVLIGISILVASGFLISFIWAMKNGQYDDTYSPSVRMLFEDEKKQKTRKEKCQSRDGNVKQEKKA